MTVLDRIRERRGAATPGPYEYRSGFYGWDNGLFPMPCEDDLNGSIFANNGHENGDPSEADADFLAHSWDDIGTLLALVEKAGEMREPLDRARRTHNVRGSDGPCDCLGCRALDAFDAAVEETA